VTQSPPTVIQFSASSSVDILPPAEMEESWDGGTALGSQRMQPLPSRLCLPLRQGEMTQSSVKPGKHRALHSPDRCQASLISLHLPGRCKDTFWGRLAPASSLSSGMWRQIAGVSTRKGLVLCHSGTLYTASLGCAGDGGGCGGLWLQEPSMRAGHIREGIAREEAWPIAAGHLRAPDGYPCQLSLVAKDVGDLLAPVIPCAHVGP
jgi:hypothetical protein